MGISGVEGNARRFKGSRLFAVSVGTARLILVTRFEMTLLV